MKITKNMKSDFDDFLKEEGILVSSESVAVKRVIAFHIKQQMDEKHISKSEMAKKMHTSRTSLDRLLDPTNNSITLATMENAAAAIGKKLKVEFV